MKTISKLIAVALAAVTVCSCDAFKTADNFDRPVSQGSPYELIVIAENDEWQGELGDTLRAVLQSPVPVLNQTEPLFDLLRTLPSGFKNLVQRHRNILDIDINPEHSEAGLSVQYDRFSSPQVILQLTAPNLKSATAFVDANRQMLLQVLESTERDRTIAYGQRHYDKGLLQLLYDKFGITFNVPKGYVLRNQTDDFAWISFEMPQSSMGFFIYSYPYTGPKDLSHDALLAARNKYAALIPGPSDGSYMTTAEIYDPDYRTFRSEGRLWAELRGFWDVANDFMGGPFVSYTTVNTTKNEVVTLDCYVYSPKLPKRNYMRELEHLRYLISFPEDAPAAAPATENATENATKAE